MEQKQLLYAEQNFRQSMVVQFWFTRWGLVAFGARVARGSLDHCLVMWLDVPPEGM